MGTSKYTNLKKRIEIWFMSAVTWLNYSAVSVCDTLANLDQFTSLLWKTTIVTSVFPCPFVIHMFHGCETMDDLLCTHRHTSLYHARIPDI